MRDVVTKQHRLSLAGREPGISPDRMLTWGIDTACVEYNEDEDGCIPSDCHPM